jgi:6-phosphogluconolactonase
MSKIKIFETEELLSKSTADFIVKLSAKTIDKSGKFTIALSGGSTPDKLFALLANEPYNKQLDWKNIFVFWGDERYLPASNPSNNSHQAKKILLSNVHIPAENIFPIPTRFTPAKAAVHYEQTIKTFFKNDFPAFDLILLGMGDNGHTASLFPFTTILEEKDALVKEVFVQEVDMFRISFTAKLINHAKTILFLVTGKKKASMLHTILEGKENIEKYPAQMIKADKGGKLLWYVDKAAAAKLKNI